MRKVATKVVYGIIYVVMYPTVQYNIWLSLSNSKIVAIIESLIEYATHKRQALVYIDSIACFCFGYKC